MMVASLLPVTENVSLLAARLRLALLLAPDRLADYRSIALKAALYALDANSSSSSVVGT